MESCLVAEEQYCRFLWACFLFLETREEERRILEKAGYFQSITVGVAPVVMVIASVVTFSVHMILGFDLTAAQVSELSGLGKI